MAPTFPHEKHARASRPETDDPFAEQLRLSRVHTRLVPMRRTALGYSIELCTADWFELPHNRGFAGYGLGRALRLLLDAMQGLSALHETATPSGEPFAHGEFAPLHFRVDPLGVCRLVPLTTRHYISEDVSPPRAALGFLSPERLIAEKIGIRADVFSAGVLLWEALSGRRLTDEHSSDAIIERLLSGSSSVPPLPPELAWATPLKIEVERALSVNQRRRFADCAEFSQVILRVVRERVADHAEIAAFFAALRNPPPNSPASPPPSSAPSSHERQIAARGATLRMLPSTSRVDPAANGGAPAGEPPRHATLKMNVTLRMAQVPLPIIVDVPQAPVAQHDRAERVSEAGALVEPPAANSSSERPRSSPPAANPSLERPRSSPPPLRSSSPPPLARLTPPPLPPEPPPTRPSQPPLLPRVMAPSPTPRLAPTTPLPTLLSSLTRSTPPPLPPMSTPAQPQVTTAPPSAPPPLFAGSPESAAAMPALTRSVILPDASPSVRSSAESWGSPRRWLVPVLLIGAIAGVGIVATRGARSAAVSARRSPVRSVSLSTAAAVASSSTAAPSVGARLAAPQGGDAEQDPSTNGALGIPNTERSVGSPPPAPRGRSAPSPPAQARRDYGI